MQMGGYEKICHRLKFYGEQEYSISFVLNFFLKLPTAPFRFAL
jgi:hypothetical protein